MVGDDLPEDYCLNALVPVPDEVVRAGYECEGAEWCSNFWGVTDDVYMQVCRHNGYTREGKPVINYRFNTPEGSPTVWFRTVAKQFPHLEFEVTCFATNKNFQI